MDMNKKKKVGIMTMHKVLNYGSALQAYALQKKILDLGFDCEIIDYIFPNVEHLLYQNPNGIKEEESFYSYLRPLLAFCKRKITGLSKIKDRKRALFESFYEKYLILSPKQYSTRLVLEKDPPIYDIYLTGSDQVWNSKYVGYDTSFMFSFVKDKNPRISYAASFSSATIPEYYKSYYKTELSKYLKISVREKSGIFIVHELVNKNAELVCDPTLLLDKEEWSILAKESCIRLNEKYILVYVLDYAYDPYPDIYSRIEEIQQKIQLPIVVLSGRKQNFLKNAKFINVAGPCEFLSLFMNASFIITNSFHGTAFALIFEKYFVSVIKDRTNEDSRVLSLLLRVKREYNSVIYNQPINLINDLFDNECNTELDDFRSSSIQYLRKELSV